MFSRIITSSNGFNIPINIKVFLNCHDIIKIDDGEQINETNNAPGKQSKYCSVYLLIFGDKTWHLKEHLSIVITYIFLQFTVFDIIWSIFFIPLFGADSTFLFIITLFNNSLVHFHVIQVTAASFSRFNIRRILPNCFFSTINHWFETGVHNTNLWISNVNNSNWAGEIDFSKTNSFYITTNRGSSIITER